MKCFFISAIFFAIISEWLSIYKKAPKHNTKRLPILWMDGYGQQNLI